MTDHPLTPSGEPRSPPTWRNQASLLLLGAIIVAVVGIAVQFGGTVLNTDKRSDLLTYQVAQLLKSNEEQEKLLNAVGLKLGSLYTRDEAQRDREASERRSQALDGRVDAVMRRLEAIEQVNRFLEQAVLGRLPRR